jgi:hypothetical protein
MKKEMSQIFAGALIAGLLSGAAALADEAKKTDAAAPQGVEGKKDSCKGHVAKDKDSCKGHKKKKNKDSCNGKKDGCSSKDKGKAADKPADKAPEKTAPAQ